MTYKVPTKQIPKPMPELSPIYHRKRHGTGVAITAWAFLYACTYVYGKCVIKGLDWFGEKLVHLIDHSDFFAGCVWTYVVMTAWELITR